MNIWEKLGIALLSIIVVFSLTLATLAIFSSGKIDYCVIDTMTYTNPLAGDIVRYDLVGHVPWRPNRQLARNLSSLALAKDQADMIGCEIK